MAATAAEASSLTLARKAKRMPRVLDSSDEWFANLAAIDATNPHDASEGMATYRSASKAPKWPVAAASKAALFFACRDAPGKTTRDLRGIVHGALTWIEFWNSHPNHKQRIIAWDARRLYKIHEKLVSRIGVFLCFNAILHNHSRGRRQNLHVLNGISAQKDGISHARAVPRLAA
jgi:hypothetical protein